MECLNEILARTVRILGHKPFLITDTETITYAEFDRRVSRLANVLIALGVHKGDPVGLYLPSNALLVTGYWACQKIGAIPTPMSMMYRDTEIRGIITRTDMRVILTSGVTDGATAPHALAVRATVPGLAHVLVSGGASVSSSDTVDGRSIEQLMAAASDQCATVQCAPDDTACLFFTSGTTGLPKGAMHSQLSQYSTLRDMMVYNRFLFDHEVFLDVLPVFNNFGATCKMNLAIFAGATMVMQERWDTRAVLDAMRVHGVTYFCGTPTMFVYLCNEFDPARDDLSSLRLALTGGAPVSPEIMKRFEESFGVRLVQVYGATESTGYITGEPLLGVRRYGSAGLAFGSSSIEIVDDDGNPVPVGEKGEVRVSGDCVGKGYWRDPETSTRTFTSKGWLSGDIGYLDADNYLYIADRKKDLIISGGYNIYPIEVEDLLYQHPAVGVCAMVGIPDSVKGEIPVALVVVKAGQQIGARDLIDYCREHVAAYKAPRQIFFIDEMPLGPSGKILKRELREWIKTGDLKAAA